MAQLIFAAPTNSDTHPFHLEYDDGIISHPSQHMLNHSPDFNRAEIEALATNQPTMNCFE
jgi:hypothetical protein